MNGSATVTVQLHDDGGTAMAAAIERGAGPHDHGQAVNDAAELRQGRR